MLLEGVNHVLYIFVFPAGPGTVLVRTGRSGNGRWLHPRACVGQKVWVDSSSEGTSRTGEQLISGKYRVSGRHRGPQGVV